MRLLDKYILKAFVGPFLFGVFAFTSIFIGTGTLFRIAQYITEYGAPLVLVMKAFLLALPSIVILTFPMSVLLASLMTFSRLSSTSAVSYTHLDVYKRQMYYPVVYYENRLVGYRELVLLFLPRWIKWHQVLFQVSVSV